MKRGNLFCFICLILHLLSLMVSSEDTKKGRNTNQTRMRWQMESPGIWHETSLSSLTQLSLQSKRILEPHLQLWHYTWKTDCSPPHPGFLLCCNKKQISSFILHRNSWLQVDGSLSCCGAFGHSPKQVQQGRAAEPHTPPSLVSQAEFEQFPLPPSVWITLAQAGALKQEFYNSSEKVKLLWASFPFTWLLLGFGKIWELKKNCGDITSKIQEIFIQTLLEIVVQCTDFASLYFSSKLHFYLCTVYDVSVLLVCLLLFKVRWPSEEKALERTCVKPLREPNFTEQQRLFSFSFCSFYLDGVFLLNWLPLYVMFYFPDLLRT